MNTLMELDNQKSKLKNPKWQPSPDQLSVLQALVREAEAEKSNADFCRKFCDFGPSKWSKILNVLNPECPASYFDEISDPDAELESLELLLTNVRLQKAADTRRGLLSILPLTPFRAVKQAVRECINKQSPERIVKYLAPTGGGKTMLCNYLEETMKARVVESRAAWKSSYFTVLNDLVRAVGARVPKGKHNYGAWLEDALITAGNERQIVIAIDEAEFFGAAALNGLKLLLNQARFVFVICAIPEAHARWNNSCQMEADQIARRTHSWVQLTSIDPADARLFFPEDQFADPAYALFGGKQKEGPALDTGVIPAAAAQFGHYSLIRRVANRLANIKRATPLDVDKAIKGARREMLMLETR